MADCIEGLAVRVKTGKATLFWSAEDPAAITEIARSEKRSGPFTIRGETTDQFYFDPLPEQNRLYYYRVKSHAQDCASLIAAWSPVRRQRLTTVPALTGVAAPDAEALLSAASLRLGTVGQIASTASPAGLVATQDPPPGSAVPSNYAVDVRLATETLDTTLSGDTTVSARVGAAGAELSTVAPDGTSYRLMVPAGALPTSPSPEVSVTPIIAMDGLPLSGGLLGGVQLQPDGLKFFAPVNLQIDFPAPIEPGAVLGFRRGGPGGILHLYPVLPTDMGAQSVILRIWGFSDIGAGDGSADDASGFNPPQFSDEYYLQKLAEVLKDVADRQFTGGGDGYTDAELVRIDAILSDWFNALVRGGLQDATNAVELSDGISRFLAWQGMLQSLLGDLNLTEQIKEGLDLIADKIEGFIAELEQACLAEADFCKRSAQVESFAELKETAQFLLDSVDTTAAIPELEEFCDGVVNRLPVVLGPDDFNIAPGRVGVLAGDEFLVSLTIKNAFSQQISVAELEKTPFVWRTEGPVTVLAETAIAGKPALRGRAQQAVDTATVTAELCGTAIATIDVFEMTGIWRIETNSAVNDCIPPDPAPPPGNVAVVQVGDVLHINNPAFGEDQAGTIFNRDPADPTRGTADDLPYGFSFPEQTSDDTVDCRLFFADIETYLAGGCDEECVPLTCSETWQTSGLVGDDGESFAATTNWSARWSYLPEAGAEVVRQSCSGTDQISGQRF